VKRGFIKPLGEIPKRGGLEACDEFFDCLFSSELGQLRDPLCSHRLATSEEKMTRLLGTQGTPSREAKC